MFAPSKYKLKRNILSQGVPSPPSRKLVTETSLFQETRETVLIFGGLDPHSDYGAGRNTGKDIFQYVPDQNSWQYVGGLPEPRHHHSVQFFKGRIFLVGGADPRGEDETVSTSFVVSSVWSFDPVTLNWFSETPLWEPRKNFGLVASNHGLYAIGGQGKNYEALKSVERYNMETKSWDKMAPMINARTGLACTKFRNNIWVAGGISGNDKKITILDSVENYQLRTNQWTVIKYPLRSPRCFASMFVMSDNMYIIGGAGKIPENEKRTTSLSAVDRWDEKKMEWKTITDLNIPRHGHCVSYIGTQLLIIGGVATMYSRALSNTECFCSQREIWVRGLACLPTALSGHSAVTLPPASMLSSYF